MNRPDIEAITARVERATGLMLPVEESGSVGPFGLYDTKTGGPKLAEFARPGDMILFRHAPTDLRALLEYVKELERAVLKEKAICFVLTHEHRDSEHVANKLDIPDVQAMELLDELVADGRLSYE